MVESKRDHSTIDLASSRLKLRSDLVFIPQPYRGLTYYHIEVPAASLFFRIGYAEYTFISLFDGETTFAEALTITAQKLGPSALTQPQALTVFSWLIENELATLVNERRNEPRRFPNRREEFFSKVNPFWAKIPLCRPDRLIAAICPSVGWVFSLPAVLCSLALFGAAVFAVSSQWDRFLAASDTVFSPTNWLWLLVAWIVLKIVHEFAHGVACKLYGGEVREMGLVFILLAPMAYVDVTSSWKFSSKWRRIFVAAAGMYVELTIAALATLIWSRTHSELTAHLLYNIIIMASFSTVVFNLNPLMRFDGYYILADWLEIPNLYSEASQFVRQRIVHLFYGTRPTAPKRIGKSNWLIGAYGIAAMLWRVVVCVSLVLVASSLFRGAGIVIAVAGVASWFGKPLKSTVTELARLTHESPRTFFRAMIVSTIIAAIGVTIFTIAPNPTTVTAPGIVDYEDLAVVRSGISGFVGHVHVQDGQFVESGALLLELVNHDIVNEYHEIIHSIEQSRIRHCIAVDRHQTTAAQVERRKRQALEQRLVEKRRQYDALLVRAPVAGRIVARSLSQMDNAYVQEGQELLSIGNDDNKELVLSIAHSDVDEVLPLVGSQVYARVGSRSRFRGTLKRVDPRASTNLAHVALAATDGGPLAVSESEETEPNGPTSMQLVEPRFRAVVALPKTSSLKLFCGERGYAVLGRRQSSLGSDVRSWLEDWVERKIR